MILAHLLTRPLIAVTLIRLHVPLLSYAFRIDVFKGKTYFTLQEGLPQPTRRHARMDSLSARRTASRRCS